NRVTSEDPTLAIASGPATYTYTFKSSAVIKKWNIKIVYQLKDAAPLLKDLAKEYRENEELAKGMDSVLGSGAAKYIGEAIEAFYSSPGFFDQV
ncbi:MAG: hypothetical protein IKW90_17180, partial [Lachnospiraceae bacterium]|nr:hypothetical protein [Lachnospiraceae bacterium]